MAKKDYVSMWFLARREMGIRDNIYYGWYDPETNHIDWQTWQHADSDGMGGYARIFRPLGFPSKPLPTCKETAVPGWREIMKAQKAFPTPKAPKHVNWKQTYSYEHNDQFLPECGVMPEHDKLKLVEVAKRRNVSLSNLVFATLSQVVSEQLIDGDEPFYWLFPVNVRGAVKDLPEYSNQASGIYMLVTPDSEAEDWQTQMRQRLKSKEHWANWKLANIGKYIGMWGVRKVYKATSKSQYVAGNCSSLGQWPLPHPDNRKERPFGKKVVFTGTAPGTENYPISSNMLEWFGDLSLAIKLHPYICNDQATVRRLMDGWMNALYSLIPEDSTARTQASIKTHATETAE